MARVACPKPRSKPKSKPKSKPVKTDAGVKRKRTSGAVARNPLPSTTSAAPLPAIPRRKVPLVSSRSPYLPPRSETPDAEEDVEAVEAVQVLDSGEDVEEDVEMEDGDGDDGDDDYVDTASGRARAAAAARTNGGRHPIMGRKSTKRGARGTSTARGKKKDEGITCVCGKYCSRLTDYPRHEVSCSLRDPEAVIDTFRCPICGRLFNRRQSAERHGTGTHQGVAESIEYIKEPMQNKVFDKLTERQPGGPRKKSLSKPQKKSKENAKTKSEGKVPKGSRQASTSRRAETS